MGSRGLGGIGVVAGWGGVDSSAVMAEKMRAAAPHRGGVLRLATNSGGFVAVTGDQGVGGLAERDGWALAYAGAVDNPEDLGLPPEGNGDQVARGVLAAFQREGPSSFSRLRGSFSVAILTPDSLILGRDHLGLASLFYRKSGDRMWAASEAKQVVAGSAVRKEPDMDVVEAIFFGRDHDDLPSALAGVDRVPRAGSVLLSGGTHTVAKYWDPSSLVEMSSATLDELPERFHEHMDQAVRRVMRGADAISLSGGIDSPAVAGYAAPAHLETFDAPLAAVSYVYPDSPSVDESHYIGIVAERLGMPLHTRVPEARPTDDLGDWVRVLDGPFPVISVAESSEFYGWARSLGYDTILTGEWAEFVTEMSTHTLQQLLIAGRWDQARRRYTRERAGGRSGAAIARRVLPTLLPDPLRDLARRLQGKGNRVVMPAWITTRPLGSPPRVPPRQRWTQDQLSFFQGAGVMIDAHDVITSMHRVQVRRPFADIDLWELFLGLRAEVKHADPRRKALLRRMLRGRVPDEILDRRDKTVFDENLLARIDYEELGRWVAQPKHQLPWIDYDLLTLRLERRDLDLREFMWMKDLAAVQAFLEQW